MQANDPILDIESALQWMTEHPNFLDEFDTRAFRFGDGVIMDVRRFFDSHRQTVMHADPRVAAPYAQRLIEILNLLRSGNVNYLTDEEINALPDFFKNRPAPVTQVSAPGIIRSKRR